jgi:excisionase family DNA binding protein
LTIPSQPVSWEWSKSNYGTRGIYSSIGASKRKYQEEGVSNYSYLKLLTIKDVTELFNIKESKLRRAILNNEIPYIKLGGLIRFRITDLERYLYYSRIDCKNLGIGLHPEEPVLC